MFRFAPLLLLPLLLAACALPVRDGMVLRAPQESPTAALQGIESGKQAQSAPQATQKPTERPVDDDATKIALYDAIATAGAKNTILLQELAAQNAEAERIKLDTQKSVEQTAKYNAANQRSVEQQKADEIAAKNADARLLEAVNDGKRLDVELAKSQAAIADAQTRALVALFVIVAACVAGIWFTPRMRLPRQGAAVEAEPQERSPFVERTAPAFGTRIRRETPPGWSLELMAAFAQTVRRADYLQGKPLTRDEWLGANGLLTRPQWIQLETYITETNPYAYAVNNTGSLGWTPAGEQWVALFDGEQVEPLPHSEENQDL